MEKAVEYQAACCGHGFELPKFHVDQRGHPARISPSTYALIGGLAVLGLILVRRRFGI